MVSANRVRDLGRRTSQLAVDRAALAAWLAPPSGWVVVKLNPPPAAAVAGAEESGADAADAAAADTAERAAAAAAGTGKSGLASTPTPATACWECAVERVFDAGTSPGIVTSDFR